MRRLSLVLVLVLCGCATASAGGERNSRSMITRAEITNNSATNAYDLVQSMRSEWLRTRGNQTLHEAPTGVSTGNRTMEVTHPGTGTIVVYLDNARLGGVETLRGIALNSVHSIQFLNAAVANYRWGAGHSHGVILVSTQPER